MRVLRLTLIIVIASASFALAQKSTQREWLEGARAKIAELQKSTDKAIGAAEAARKSNDEAQQEVGTKKAEAEQLAKDANMEREAKIKAETQRDHVLKLLHRYKFAASIIGTLGIIFACLYFKIPPPLLFYMMGAGALAGNAVIWLFT